RWCAWSMISLALLRAALSSSFAVSWACASARWLLSAAARPSAIFCWRSSMALSSGGQTKVAISQISAANESAWAIRVRLMFMALPVVVVGACGAVHAGPAAWHGRPWPPAPCAAGSAGQARQGVGPRTDERAGEGEQQADGDRDDGRGVDQAGGDEHADLQHRDQLGLARGRLEELAGHDGQAEAGAERGEADHDADTEGGEGLDLGKRGEDGFHGDLRAYCLMVGRKGWGLDLDLKLGTLSDCLPTGSGRRSKAS